MKDPEEENGLDGRARGDYRAWSGRHVIGLE